MKKRSKHTVSPVKAIENQPVNKVQWLHREKLRPNNYNPNAVAPPEMELLKISIIEDGWTQPIVVNPDLTIVDGFHRWTVSGDLGVYGMTGGMVPVVILQPRDENHQRMSTIRHNRARGTHRVLNMSEIVKGFVDAGMKGEEICQRLQMEPEEVTRLLFRLGIPKSAVFSQRTYSPSWNPHKDSDVSSQA